MSADTIHQSAILSGRQLMLAAVIALHALVIAALMTMKFAVDRPPPLPGFQPIHAPAAKPLPPPERPRLQPDDNTPSRIAWPVPQDPVITSVVPSVPTDARPITLPTDPVLPSIGEPGPPRIAPTELSYRATRSPDDFYPALSIQLQEEGVTEVRVCVSPSGRLEGAPTVERTSGSRRLDAAAIQWAREALVFTPATRNGSAVAACKGFRVNFRLR